MGFVDRRMVMKQSFSVVKFWFQSDKKLWTKIERKHNKFQVWEVKEEIVFTSMTENRVKNRFYMYDNYVHIYKFTENVDKVFVAIVDVVKEYVSLRPLR